MASDAADERSTRPLLTLGRVDVVRVQVGYRVGPESPARQQFLLDLPVPEADDDHGPDIDDQRVLAALEPVLYVGSGPPRHYSLHRHRWHTSWGASPGALEIGLLVTVGTRISNLSEASTVVVSRAFRDLLDAAGPPRPTPTPREAAVLRARRSVATAFSLDPDALFLSAEQHHRAESSWALRLRTASGEDYDVCVGFVDGYAGSVRVRQEMRTEVYDAVGSE